MISSLVFKEVKAQLKSFHFWGFVALFLFVLGILFIQHLYNYAQSFQALGALEQGKLSFFDLVVFQFLGNINLLFLLFSPILVLRLTVLEDRSAHEDFYWQVGVKDSSFILGKWGSSILLSLAILGMTMVFPMMLYSHLTAKVQVLLGGYLALICQIACYLSIGMFCSMLFKGVLLSFLSCVFISVGIWTFSWGAMQFQNEYTSSIFHYLSFSTHLTSMLQGEIRLSHFIYYASLVTLFLLLSLIVKSSKRYS